MVENAYETSLVGPGAGRRRERVPETAPIGCVWDSTRGRKEARGIGVG
jgi:hypothetical protein